MSVSVKLGNDTLTGVDSVRLEDANSAGNYITFSLASSPPSTPTDAVIFYSSELFSVATYNMTKNWNGTLYYSTDYSTWNTWAGTNMISAAKNGDWYKLYLRGNGNTYLTTSGTNTSARWFFSGVNIKCCGNLNNLLSYNGTATMANNAFSYLFNGVGNVNFDVTLPSTTLTARCYQGLFTSCSSLTTAPQLPAQTLAEQCYNGMFSGCISLRTPPELPATTLASGCYSQMFANSGISDAPKLSVTTLATSCYQYMFNNCKGLTSLPALPSTSLVSGCYGYMFQGCINIKLSTTRTGAYQTTYRIPTSGKGSAVNYAMQNMFTDTGGTLTGTPTINTTYYTSNTVVS